MVMSFEARLHKVSLLSKMLGQCKARMVELAVKNLQFTVKDSVKEVDLVIDSLSMYDEARRLLADRVPLGGPDSSVSLILSYNGSAWLNAAITSIYMVGNRVNVKFSSKGDDVMALTKEMYQPIFGEDITFYRGSGESFIEKSLKDPTVSAVVVFGFDENIMPYQKAVEQSGKKLIFEGPGQDPFIVFPDADLDLALDDLVTAKFIYSGQTCTAPKRIFIHRSIYESFLERFVDRVKQLVVGDPADAETDISAVASGLAVRRIANQLADAVQKGAEILVGGSIVRESCRSDGCQERYRRHARYARGGVRTRGVYLELRNAAGGSGASQRSQIRPACRSVRGPGRPRCGGCLKG